MNNYEYIIASLPDITPDTRTGLDADEVLSEIRRDLSEKDRETLDFLLSSYEESNIDRELYLKASASANRFIRGYFAFDLDLRNAKVRYLNEELGRPRGTDELMLDDSGFENDEASAGFAQLSQGGDLLERELGLDRLVWRKVDELNSLDIFDLDLVLGFVVKLKIVERWMKLDPETGRRLFRQLIEEIKETDR